MEHQGLVCRVCRKRVRLLNAETNVCPTCEKTKDISKEVGRPAWEIMRKPYNNHPGDHYLDIVLAAWGTREWVTWIHNKSVGGYGEGHYFTDYDDALEDFFKRGNLPPQDFSVCVFLNVKAYSPRSAEELARQAINTFDTPVDIVTMAVGQLKEDK